MSLRAGLSIATPHYRLRGFHCYPSRIMPAEGKRRAAIALHLLDRYNFRTTPLRSFIAPPCMCCVALAHYVRLHFSHVTRTPRTRHHATDPSCMTAATSLPLPAIAGKLRSVRCHSIGHRLCIPHGWSGGMLGHTSPSSAPRPSHW